MHPSLQFGEGSFTAEAWIYPQSVPDTTGARIVNNRGTGIGGSYPGWHLKIKNQTGNWRFGDSGIDDAAGNYKPYEATATYPYNQWYQVVMVYEADSEMRFYVNGALDGTVAVGDYGSITNTHPTVIGASIVHEGTEHGDDKQFFDGIIDEVRLSDTVKSAEWIETGFNNQDPLITFYTVGTECIADDVTCDGIDDDCDGTADEDYTPTQHHVRTGACASTSTLSCIAGSEVDSCHCREHRQQMMQRATEWTMIVMEQLMRIIHQQQHHVVQELVHRPVLSHV